MVDPQITNLVRDALAARQRRVNELREEVQRDRDALARRELQLTSAEAEAAPFVEFLRAHGEASADEALKLRNVVTRMSWPGKDAGQEGGEP